MLQLPSSFSLSDINVVPQLNLQMVAGLAFNFYSEARITFMPTYKFDVGTDVYDTSLVESCLPLCLFPRY